MFFNVLFDRGIRNRFLEIKKNKNNLIEYDEVFYEWIREVLVNIILEWGYIYLYEVKEILFFKFIVKCKKKNL